jgi:hypothetical protein
MVKLNVSFYKSWCKTNEMKQWFASEFLWGKLAHEKWKLLSQRILD